MDKRSRHVKEASMAKDNPHRADRLAEALRANLRRRKAQAREIGQRPDDENPPLQPSSGGPPAAPGGG
jgi:plasmid stabilization system protein ParE